MADYLLIAILIMLILIFLQDNEPGANKLWWKRFYVVRKIRWLLKRLDKDGD